MVKPYNPKQDMELMVEHNTGLVQKLIDCQRERGYNRAVILILAVMVMLLSTIIITNNQSVILILSVIVILLSTIIITMRM